MHARKMNVTNGLALAALLLAATTGAAVADDPILVDLVWDPPLQVVQLGDTVNVELWAYPNQTVDFNSAQVIMTWDPIYLELTGTVDPAYPPPPGTSIWSSSFPYGDSFGINEASPLPVDGDGLWIGEVDVGQTLPATSSGLLLSTITFQALALTAGTPVEMLWSMQLPGSPLARSKFNVGTQNVLNSVGNPAIVVIPEPASLVLLGGGVLVGLGLRRTKRK